MAVAPIYLGILRRRLKPVATSTPITYAIGLCRNVIAGSEATEAISKTGLLRPFGARNDTHFTITTQSDCKKILL